MQEVRIRHHHVGNDSVVVNLLPRVATDVTELVRKPRLQDVRLQARHSVTAREEEYRSGHAPICAEIPASERGVRQVSATPGKTVWSQGYCLASRRQLDSAKGREVEGCEIKIQPTGSGEVHDVTDRELLSA